MGAVFEEEIKAFRNQIAVAQRDHENQLNSSAVKSGTWAANVSHLQFSSFE